jgi:hypothetical protein
MFVVNGKVLSLLLLQLLSDIVVWIQGHRRHPGCTRHILCCSELSQNSAPLQEDPYYESRDSGDGASGMGCFERQ